MATRYEIKCVKTSNRWDVREGITHIGGVDGTRWTLTRQEAIAGIEDGKWEFYVRQGGREVDVVVATHSGVKYLKTKPDDVNTNNLLSLPECP